VTSSEGIRVGVVGTGAFGRHHVRHYARHPGARLVAVADADPARAATYAAETGAAAFTDHRALIGKVDAVSVAAPAVYHHAIAGDFLDAGVHVFIEKPIAVDSASATDLVARAERAGVILQVGHIERFSPAVSELAKRLADPRRIAAVRKTGWTGRSADVDVILDLMIHDIDLVLTLAGSPVKSVAANGVSSVSGLTDDAEAWLTFAGGITATLSASRSAAVSQRQLTVTEPAMVYVADLAGPTLSVRSRASHAETETIPLTPHDNLGVQIAAFLDSVANGTPPLVDGRAGAAALAIAERIQAAIADGAAPARRSM
jgi:predicted dehydrogenase